MHVLSDSNVMYLLVDEKIYETYVGIILWRAGSHSSSFGTLFNIDSRILSALGMHSAFVEDSGSEDLVMEGKVRQLPVWYHALVFSF